MNADYGAAARQTLAVIGAPRERMIALMDQFQGGRSATIATTDHGELTLTFTDVPPAAVPVLRALLAVTQTLARVERLALCAIVRRNSPERVLPLLERHKTLVDAQEALATTFVSMLQEPACENGGHAPG